MPTHFYLRNTETKDGERAILVKTSIKGVAYKTSIGISVPAAKWNESKERVSKGCLNSKKLTDSDINSRLADIEAKLSSLEKRAERPSLDEVKAAVSSLTGGGASARENGTQLLAVFDNFVATQKTARRWTYPTVQKWNSFKMHLKAYPDCPSTLSGFNAAAIAKYMNFLGGPKFQLRDSTAKKELGLLMWFLRWAKKNGHAVSPDFESNSVKFKNAGRPVVFLNREELRKVETLRIPENGEKVVLHDFQGVPYEKEGIMHDCLERVRDCFLFCCYTSLRYSDMAKLRKADIYDGAIHVTTKKTYDALTIELNDRSRAILEKYKGLRGLRALPAISNQKMNDYLKILGEFAELNSQLTFVSFTNGVRSEVTQSKYEVLTTHVGRRTFICNALTFGIPVNVVMKWTGHSDYDAMKPYIEVAEAERASAMQLFNDKLK